MDSGGEITITEIKLKQFENLQNFELVRVIQALTTWKQQLNREKNHKNTLDVHYVCLGFSPLALLFPSSNIFKWKISPLEPNRFKLGSIRSNNKIL